MGGLQVHAAQRNTGIPVTHPKRSGLSGLLMRVPTHLGVGILWMTRGATDPGGLEARGHDMMPHDGNSPAIMSHAGSQNVHWRITDAKVRRISRFRLTKP